MILKKNIPFSLLNTDDAPHILPDGSATNMRNLRFVSLHGEGRAGYFENIKSNKIVGGMDEIPAGSQTVATYEDPQNRFIIWFSHKPGSRMYDRINYYDVKFDKYWLIAQSAPLPSGGEIKGGLLFELGRHYTLKVVDSILVWVTPGQEPRKIDIGAAIKANYPNATESEVPFYKGWQYNWSADDTSIKNFSLICKPPAMVPVIAKLKDTNYTGSSGFLSDESFQFAFRYVYHTREASVLSPFSESTLINSKWDSDFNAVSITMDATEYPYPQGLKQIELFVRVASTSKIFFLNKWIVADLPEDHVIKYDFYGDFLGEALDDAAANEPFHSVPLQSGTLEFAKSRLFLGDNTEGYDTPKPTPMVLTNVIRSTPPTFNNATRVLYKCVIRGNWKKGGWSLTRPRYYYSGLFLLMNANEVSGGSPAGFYLINDTQIYRYEDFVGIPPIFKDPIPTSVTLGNLTFKGKDFDAVKEAVVDKPIGSYYETTLKPDPAYMISVVGLPSNAVSTPPIDAFLHFSDYFTGIVYYDRYLRKCGVVTDPGFKTRIPVRDYGVSSVVSAVNWKLDTSSDADYIPEWAEYYAPVLSANNRALRFVSGYAADIRYAVIDNNGAFKANSGEASGGDETPYRNFSRFTAGIAVDSSALVNVGMGYTFTEGDLAILIFKDSVGGATQTHKLPVIGQSGKYIILGSVNLKNTLAETDECVYEIYTPTKVDNPEFFYEIGQMYRVSDPGTDNRKYTIREGSFKPDTYAMDRIAGGSGGAYRGYAMSPNDLYWRRWVTHFGRLNVITETKQAYKPHSVSFSDVATNAGQNGISSFHALNQESLPEEIGRIRHLQLTTKIQREGSVMLAIGESGTVSLYLGETELMDNSGDAFVVKSNRVIGTINVLKDSYGTMHPESVASFDGSVIWFDLVRKAFVRYDSNGMFPISNYKFKRGAFLFAQRVAAIEADGVKAQINGGIDAFYKEYLVQCRELPRDDIFYCQGIDSITLSPSPTTDYPNRMAVRWVFQGGPRNFDWKYFDLNGILVSEGLHLNIASPFIQYIWEPPVKDETSFFVKFSGRSNCGAGSASPWEEIEFDMLGGTEVEPGEGCTPLVWVSPIGAALPNAYVGSNYAHQIGYAGTNPVNLTVTSKPSWMNIFTNSSQVYMTSNGLPVTAAEGTSNVQLSVSNCGPNPITLNLPITVVDSGTVDPGPSCVPLSWPGANPNDGVLPDAQIGETYSTSIPFLGTNPVDMQVLFKPNWMAVQVVSNQILLHSVGEPVYGPPLTHPVRVRLRNCGPNPLDLDIMLTILPYEDS